MQRRLLEPLGMQDTDFYVPTEKMDRLAYVYTTVPETGTMERVDSPIYQATEPPEFAGGGGMLVSTADDFLRFARMLLGGGELDGVRILRPSTVALMTENRLTPEQRQVPFLGMPSYWSSRGFGLGLSIVLDPEIHRLSAAGSLGSYGWPGAFGTWFQVDPVQQLIIFYLVQSERDLSPEGIAAIASGKRADPRTILIEFQKKVYEALE